MDTQDIRCLNCGHEDIKSIRQCPQRAWQACPYAATPFNVPPSFIGYAWPDYMDISTNIVLINIVLWAVNISFSGGRIFSIGLLALLFFQIRLFIWSSVILFVYRGFSRNSARKNQLPTFLQPLQKRLTHYYRPADRRGFVTYERFGLSTLYGTTAVIPISLTNSKTFIGKYPPSFLSIAELTQINDFNQRMLAQAQLAPQIVRWTLFGLANQDLIQLSVVKLSRSSTKNKKANIAVVVVTPKPELLSHRANGMLEKAFIRQLRRQADTEQKASHWGSISVYELVVNLYDKAIPAPVEKLTTRLIDDATAHGWADKAATKDYKAKIKSLLVIPWHLTPDHDSKVMAEQKIIATWDRVVQGEHKTFIMLINTAVQKAIQARTRKRNH